MIRWVLQRREAVKAQRRTCRKIETNRAIAYAVGKAYPVWITIVHNPDWYADSERAVVDAIIKEERRK